MICRECGYKDDLPPLSHCPTCQTARILQHRELHDLAIAHVDCDAFYASIEKRDNPALKHKPVIVGGGARGVVAAACYTARIHGIRSAMPIYTALKLCPDVTVIPPRMDAYRDVGYAIRKMMLELTPLVEPLSIDEAFMDLSGTATLHRSSAAESLIALAKKIEDEIGVSVSVGLAGNKSTAKIASDMDKPRGFHLIGVDEAAARLAPLPVSILYGAGQALVRRLARLGVHTCHDLARADAGMILRETGEVGPKLQQRARGIDPRAVTPDSKAKSISSETTFNQDIADLDTLLAWLLVLAEKVALKMKTNNIAGRRVVLKLKSRDHKTITRSLTLTASTQMSDTIFTHGRILLEREVQKTRSWRLIGIGMDQLGDDGDADPFDLADPSRQRRQKLEQAVDHLRAKHGADTIIKGRRLDIDKN
jgi:DNA polymerase-4